MFTRGYTRQKPPGNSSTKWRIKTSQRQEPHAKSPEVIQKQTAVKIGCSLKKKGFCGSTQTSKRHRPIETFDGEDPAGHETHLLTIRLTFHEASVQAPAEKIHQILLTNSAGELFPLREVQPSGASKKRSEIIDVGGQIRKVVSPLS